MNKKKTTVRAILNHRDNGSYFKGEWSTAMATCSCGWERECGDRIEADKLHAKHIYSMIKEALKTRKLIRSL